MQASPHPARRARLAELTATMTRHATGSNPASVETFSLSVTSSGGRDIIEALGAHWTGSCAGLPAAEAVDLLETWAILHHYYDLVDDGCRYLIDDALAPMRALARDGHDLWIA